MNFIMNQFISRIEVEVGDNNSSTFELRTCSTFVLDEAENPKLGIFFKECAPCRFYVDEDEEKNVGISLIRISNFSKFLL